MPTKTTSWVAHLLERMARYPTRLAVQSQASSVTYAQLLEQATSLRDKMLALGVSPGERIALLGERGVGDYIGMMAILLAGCAYVPLNAKFPKVRNRYILEKSGATAILVDSKHAKSLDGLAVGVSARFALCTETGMTLDWYADRADADNEPFEDGIYLIFTSGTTGQPKGVPITGANLGAYVDNLGALFPITPEDKVAHLSDLYFDFSVHEIFMTWYNGAALCVIPLSSVLLASRYVEDEEITVWVSVPSTISLAHGVGALKPGSMRSIRLGFFCGEALSLTTAKHFATAAPAAEIVNLWGPTETTVSFSYFRVDLAQSLPDIIPIGKAYSDQRLALVDENLRVVNPGQIGELIAFGSQVTDGYWRSAELNAEKFIQRDGMRWYRTGDLALWDERYGYCYRGRADRQVKIKGYRVELQDCESAIRTLINKDLVCVVPWPKAENGAAAGLVGFICATSLDPSADESGLRESLKASLPVYMIPARILFLEHFPFNANGKIDYKQLEQEAEQQLSVASAGGV